MRRKQLPGQLANGQKGKRGSSDNTSATDDDLERQKRKDQQIFQRTDLNDERLSYSCWEEKYILSGRANYVKLSNYPPTQPGTIDESSALLSGKRRPNAERGDMETSIKLRGENLSVR